MSYKSPNLAKILLSLFNCYSRHLSTPHHIYSLVTKTPMPTGFQSQVWAYSTEKMILGRNMLHLTHEPFYATTIKEIILFNLIIYKIRTIDFKKIYILIRNIGFSGIVIS